MTNNKKAITTNLFSLTFTVCELWKFVNMFTRVLAVWHTKAKVEVKTFQKPFFKVVPFNHAKVLHWFIADCEFNPKNNRGKILCIEVEAY